MNNILNKYNFFQQEVKNMPRIPEKTLEKIKREVSIQSLEEAKGIKLTSHGFISPVNFCIFFFRSFSNFGILFIEPFLYFLCAIMLLFLIWRSRAKRFLYRKIAFFQL
jgi:hypothetical protein